MFKDRVDAGQQLAAKLLYYSKKNPIIFALPRGGVVLGHIIAKQLKCPLDVFVVKKISHPNQIEYAIGAVAENGQTLLNFSETSLLPAEWLKQSIQKNLTAARARRRLYSGNSPMLNPVGKTAIVVDDGVATGTTITLALQEIKKLKPRELICAVPVLPSETAHRLKSLVDKLIYIEIPEYFLSSVGAYYKNFEEIKDDQVLVYLKNKN